MIIWRVEDEHGIGPYHYYRNNHKAKGELSEELRSDHSTTGRHPGPYEDGMGNFMYRNNYKPLFGFDSKEKALEWFDGYWDALNEAGFKLKSFEVDEKEVFISLSGKQLAFNRK